jgi:hypothetical protein
LPEKCFASRENDELNLFGKLGFSEKGIQKLIDIRSAHQGCSNYTFGVFFYTRFEMFKINFRDKMKYKNRVFIDFYHIFMKFTSEVTRSGPPLN